MKWSLSRESGPGSSSSSGLFQTAEALAPHPPPRQLRGTFASTEFRPIEGGREGGGGLVRRLLGPLAPANVPEGFLKRRLSLSLAPPGRVQQQPLPARWTGIARLLAMNSPASRQTSPGMKRGPPRGRPPATSTSTVGLGRQEGERRGAEKCPRHCYLWGERPTRRAFTALVRFSRGHGGAQRLSKSARVR